MTTPRPHDTATTAASAPPARRRRSISKTALFALFALTLVLALAAAALTVFNLRGLRAWRYLRVITAQRQTSLTMATFPNVVTPARAAYLRTCYEHPDKIDYAKISWDLFCRPAPFVGYAPEPGRQGEGTFNAQGMRNREDVNIPKPAGVYRIIMTGGSLAYGIGAPTQDDTIPARLEKILNERKPWPGKRVEVFNAAVCGWASTNERIFIENRVVDWQPDLVLALTGVNDAHWAFNGADIRYLRTYEDEMYFGAINEAMRWSGAKDYPPAPPRDAIALPPGSKPVDPATVAERFVRNERLAALALEPCGGRLVIALQPTCSEAGKTLAEGERKWIATEPQGKVEYLAQCFAAMEKELAARPATPRNALDHNPANMNVIAIRDVFAGRSDPIYFDLYHMGDKGNEIVAKRIADELQKLK